MNEEEFGRALLVVIGSVALAIYAFSLSINVSFGTGLKVVIGLVFFFFLAISNWKARRLNQGFSWTIAAPVLVGFVATLFLPVLEDWSALAISKPDFGTPWNPAPWYTNPYFQAVACLSPGFITWGIMRLAKRIAG